MKTADNDRNNPDDVLVRNLLCDYFQKNRMSDVCEKFSDVAFEHPYRPSVVLGNLADEFSESAESAMRPFPVLAGVRVGNKSLCEKRRQLPVQSVMQ